MLGRSTASPRNLMGEMSDRYFLCPRSLLAASKVNIYDAINLVVYAKLPLKNVLRGKALVAWFFERDGTGASSALIGTKQKEELLDRYGKELAPLHYPVGPHQYESLLEVMLEAGENIFPVFFHEHHLLIDRRVRATMFSQIHRELMEDVQKGNVILQISDSKRANLLTSDAWMTENTLRTYLDHHGVTPWWKNEANLASHARIERILPSDAVNLPDDYAEEYDPKQLPSFVFGKMLLKRSYLPPGYRGPAQAARASNDSDVTTTVPPGTPGSRQPKESRKALQVRAEPSEPDTTADKGPSAPVVALPAGRQDVLVSDVEHADSSSPSMPDDVMLTKKQVAALIGISVSSVDNFRKRAEFPKEVTYGEITKRWRKSAILQWLKQREDGSTH